MGGTPNILFRLVLVREDGLNHYVTRQYQIGITSEPPCCVAGGVSSLRLSSRTIARNGAVA